MFKFSNWNQFIPFKMFVIMKGIYSVFKLQHCTLRFYSAINETLLQCHNALSMAIIIAAITALWEMPVIVAYLLLHQLYEMKTSAENISELSCACSDNVVKMLMGNVVRKLSVHCSTVTFPCQLTLGHITPADITSFITSHFKLTSTETCHS